MDKDGVGEGRVGNLLLILSCNSVLVEVAGTVEAHSCPKKQKKEREGEDREGERIVSFVAICTRVRREGESRSIEVN